MVILAIAAVLAVALGGSSSSSLKDVPAVGSLSTGPPGASDVQTMLKGIPQSGTTLGSSIAPVTMVEFIDPQCPYCQEFETQVLPDVIKRYVRTGKVKIQMQPWAFIGPDSFRGQAAELAAAEQNKAFNYTALLYDNQGEENTGWLDDNMVATIASGVPGLKVHTLLDARSSSAVKAAQAKVDASAKAYDVTGTPTLFVGKSGARGTQVNLTGPTDEASVIQAINAASA